MQNRRADVNEYARLIFIERCECCTQLDHATLIVAPLDYLHLYFRVITQQ